MALEQTKPMTVEEFDQFALLPENAHRLLEFIGGKVVEVVSNGYSSELGMLIGSFLTVFVHQHGLGRVTGADGGYWVAGERYIPNAAFISKAKQPEPPREAYNPNPPDLAVEVLSPSNTPSDIRLKIVNYLRAGTVLWVFDPDEKRVEIYAPGKAPLVLGMDGVIDGGEALPGFRLAVKDVFGE